MLTYEWDGPNIPCLEICEKDSLTSATYKVVKKVCDLFDWVNLDTLTFECIIDQSKVTNQIDLFLLFSILLKNDCDLKKLLDDKADELDTSELLVDNLDLQCLLQDYLDNYCQIVRFYNSDNSITDPNVTSTVFQNSSVAIDKINSIPVFYVSDIDQKVWTYNKITTSYEKSNTNLNNICICDIEKLDLDIKKTFQVIIRNLCQIKSTGIVKACDTNYPIVTFSNVDPNDANTIFKAGSNLVTTNKNQSAYYISESTHKIWRWVPTENSYLPSVLSGLNINLKDASLCLTTQEQALDNWIALYQVYEEPLITSCLDTNIVPTSTHIELITDPNICNLKSLIGEKEKLASLLLASCSKAKVRFSAGTDPNGLVTIFGPHTAINTLYYNESTPNIVWIWEPTINKYVIYNETIVQIENRHWVQICDYLTRLKTIETNCCTPNCDNISIGFSASMQADGIYLLTFNKAAGHSIPSGFVDCGSELFITDHKGISQAINVDLVNQTFVEVDLTLLDTAKDLTVSIKTCLSLGDTLVCKKCISKIIPALTPCGFCKLCAVGGAEDTIELFYYLASNPTNLLKVILNGGDCLTFPVPVDFPTIKSVLYSSPNITLENDTTSPCIKDGESLIIPTPEITSCWYFEMPVPTNTSVIEFKDTNSLVPSPVTSRFDLNPEATYIEKYAIYYDYLNSNGATIGGQIAEPDTYSAVNSEYNVKVLTPTGLPSNVESATPCNGYVTKVKISDFGTSTLTSAGNLVIFIPGIYNAKLGMDQVCTQKNGFILKIKNQPTNLTGIQKPEIGIKNPINGAITYIKGQLLADDCACPV